MKLLGLQLPDLPKRSLRDKVRRDVARPASAGRVRGRASFNLRDRLLLVGGALALSSVALLARALDLQVIDNEFYQQQGAARFLREIPIATSRGMITDRNGEPLAISTPVQTLWANPKQLVEKIDDWRPLASALGVAPDELERRIGSVATREFVYLRRRMTPGDAARVMALGRPGVYSRREYQRF